MKAPLPDGADERIELEDGHTACSLWWNDVPPYPGKKLGVIGAYSASSAEASDTLLAKAEARLASEGCTLAVGPMDGNTWRSYRFVTNPGDRPPFFLEPEQPADWPRFWEARGWSVLRTYSSSALLLHASPPNRDRLRKRIDAAGITIRPIALGHFEEELATIYQVAEISFRENFLYTPLPEEEFVAAYQKVAPLCVPDFILVAESKDGPAGFVFALPDANEIARDGSATTLIVKTLAVLPERRCAGLGTILVEDAQEAARRAGFTTSIHALQYQDNTSLRITERHGAQQIREYSLFQKPLT